MIRFENITAGYGAKRPLVNFMAELPETGVVAILGPSGCGKTTLLRLLIHAEEKSPAEDVPLIHEGRLTGMEGKRISAVFQEDRLLLWRTAEENVALVRPDGDAIAILSDLGLGEDAHKVYPGSLSGGMQRRVAIARALNFPRDILVLDEPFKGLDADTRQLVASRIKGAFPLTLIVTHDPAEAAIMGASWAIRLSHDEGPTWGPASF